MARPRRPPPKLPIGIIVLRDGRERVEQILPAGTPVPSRRTVLLARPYADPNVEVTLTLGEGDARADVRPIGVVRVPLTGSVVELDVVHQGDVLHVRVTDPVAGPLSEIRVDLTAV